MHRHRPLNQRAGITRLHAVLCLALLPCALALPGKIQFQPGGIKARYVGHPPSRALLILPQGIWTVIGEDEYDPGRATGSDIKRVTVTYIATDAALCDELTCIALGSYQRTLSPGEYTASDGRLTIPLELAQRNILKTAQKTYPKKNILMNYLIQIRFANGDTFSTLLE